MIADQAVTPTKLSQPLTAGTTVATTSGTTVDFTSIPSWANRITVIFNVVSTNGASLVQVQLGNGAPVTSGYSCGYSYMAAGGNGAGSATSGFVIPTAAGAASARSGSMVLTRVSGNTWVASYSIGDPNTPVAGSGGGAIALAGALDRVRLTTINGTDAFDAGSVNILYE